LRNRFWTHANATVSTFAGQTDIILPVACSFDLNLLATKYFYALGQGDIPLLFLLSGSVFYESSAGRLQMQPISWNTEAVYRVPLPVWQELMDHHFPNTGWLTLHRDVLDRLYAYKRHHGLMTWEETIERLLPAAEGVPA
jgi:hypothetical protein